MLELTALMWGMAILFAVIGFSRGLDKELISTAGIVLALFFLFQFDGLIRGTLLANVTADQVFFVQTIILVLIVYFAYQTRGLARAANAATQGRDNLQTSVLGAVVGFLNGYLVWGSVWYFMHINNYPLSPYVIAPPAGSASAEAINALPLYVLAGGPTGTGDLLALAVIALFVFVLIVI